MVKYIQNWALLTLIRPINITLGLNDDERCSKKTLLMLKQCKIYPLFPNDARWRKSDPFSTCLLTGMRSSYISEWVPQGKNDNSTTTS